MALADTKQKILDSSVLLFNEYGISNVRLQQIADETGISVGNLAYHFNNKEAITETLIANVVSGLEDLLREYGKYSLLNDLDFFFKEYYRFSNQNRFFNFDFLEIKRNFAASYESLQPVFNKIKLQLERRFELWLQQRLLQKEVNVKSIAFNAWILLFFMPAEGQINGKNTISETQYRRRLWDFIKLYFTAKGTTEFRSRVEPVLTGK